MVKREEWRDITNYEGIYQVSNHGQVRSLGKYIRGRNNSERFIAGRARKQYKDNKGYLLISLSKDNKKKTHLIHRLVLMAFDRPPKPGEQCNHKDGDKSNNFIENLELCTPKENNDHKINILGKHQRGEKNPRRKLSEQDVIEIRIHLKEGKLTQQQIADLYGVSNETISMVKTGKRWKHIK